MSTTTAIRVPEQRRRLDAAVVELVRVVTADDWSCETAAARMRAVTGGDGALLRHLKARVSRALLQRPTPVDVRAAASLDLALTGLL